MNYSDEALAALEASLAAKGADARRESLQTAQIYATLAVGEYLRGVGESLDRMMGDVNYLTQLVHPDQRTRPLHLKD